MNNFQHKCQNPVHKMIALEPITIANVMVFRAVRLRALQDAPSAFGSSYALERQFTDAEWIKRTLLWNGERGVGFLAMDGNVACGLVGSFLDADDARRAHLVSMWTAPTHRQRWRGPVVSQRSRQLGISKRRPAPAVDGHIQQSIRHLVLPPTWIHSHGPDRAVSKRFISV